MVRHGYLVLLDFIGKTLTIDGMVVESQAGFRGFDCVPFGTHTLAYKPDRSPKITIEIDVPANDAVVYELQGDSIGAASIVKSDPSKTNRYRQLALSGAMGFTLYSYPGSCKSLSQSREVVEEIFSGNNRLHYLLRYEYDLSPDDIQSVRFAPNAVEFDTKSRPFAFKLLPFFDTFNLLVFVPDPKYVAYSQALDPALWQRVNNLIDEWKDTEPVDPIDLEVPQKPLGVAFNRL